MMPDSCSLCSVFGTTSGFAPKRLFATDQFCKSLAVISCLDGPASSEDRVRSSRLLSAVGELPPKLTQKELRRVELPLVQPQAVQGFVIVGACGEVS